MTYETATSTLIKPEGPIWRALLYSGDQYLGGVDTLVSGATSDRAARLMVHATLAAQHLDAGRVDRWEVTPDGGFAVPVTAF